MRVLTIGGYHKHRQDLRRLLCFGKICDPKSNHVTPSPTNRRLWHTKYLLRLHNDLPFLPINERQGVANILSRSLISPIDPLHPTPQILSLFHLHNGYTVRGEGRYKIKLKIKLRTMGTKMEEFSRIFMKMRLMAMNMLMKLSLNMKKIPPT